jgi:1L-myo-inositol 1-phosphate cytidylyltransferase
LVYNDQLIRAIEGLWPHEKKIGRMIKPTRCVIIAAGRGSRLSARAASKPLLEVAGKPLIDRAIDAVRPSGIREFVVVTGYAGDALERHLAAKAATDGLSIATVRNDEWEKENGLSVLKAKGLAGERFLLMMADHIVDPRLPEGLAGQEIGGDEVILAVDPQIGGQPYVDLDDVTRVLDENGRIAAIGKNIPAYNAFDTGVFLCTPALFAALEASQAKGDLSLSGGIRALAAKGKARTWKTGGLFWIDVDDEEAARKAEEAVASGLAGPPATAKAPRTSWKKARFLFSGAGLLLLIYLLSKIGTRAVLVHVAQFGPWFLVIIALSLGWLFAGACAWHLIQSAYFRPVPLLRLFRVKIISDSLNTLIPSANVGGDAVRAFLIRKHAPLTEGIPGILVDKTVEYSIGLFFIMTGFLFSLLFVELPSWMNAAAAACLGGTLLGIVVLVIFQLKGIFWTLGRIGKVVPRVRRYVAKREGAIRDLDRNLHLIYRHPNPRTLLAAALHYLARVMGAAEIFIILRVLGSQITFIQSIFTATGVTIINTAFFVVPGHVGVMESAHVVILRSLGFSAALGLSLGVIRRIRKLATVALGLGLFALGKDKS